MLDVIPSGEPSDFQRGRKNDPPHLLKLEWKLPARLRRPVRRQLAKERRRRAMRKLIAFQRRPLTTRQLVRSASQAEQETLAQSNRGAEFHTGEMWRQGRARITVAPPPYQGSFLGWLGSVSRLPAFSRKNISQPNLAQRYLPRSKGYPARAKKKQLVSQSDPRRKRSRPPAFLAAQAPADTVPRGRNHLAESELQFMHDQAESRFLKQPDSKELVLPIRLSFLPLPALKALAQKIFTRSRRQRAEKMNVLIFLIGCGLLYGLVWNLQGVGRGWRVLGSVKAQAQVAYQRLAQGGQALAVADFTKSAEEFGAARAAISEAQQQFDEALAASRVILQWLDVSGTVRSGEELLKAGESLTNAGEHVARGLNHLFGARLQIAGLTEKPEPSEPSLIEAIRAGKEEFTAAEGALQRGKAALDHVSSPLLPENIDQAVHTLQDDVPRIEKLVSGFVTHSDLLLRFLGAERERQYLLLFANNYELRPVGGFLGSFSVVSVDQGVVENMDVQTVYGPDGQLKEFIAPPDPLLSITDRWYMRDANWFVNFDSSARKISEFFEKEGGPTVDGVILLTPTVIQDLLRISGPIEVPGYNLTVSADNFRAVTQHEVTYAYDREANRPKRFLADLTPLLLNKVTAKAKESKLQLAQVLMDSLNHKNLVLNFRDENLQEYVRTAGWAGELPKDQPGFLAINNANIGGHKSDQFVEQEIDYRSELLPDEDVEVTVTVRRTHRGPQEAGDYQYPENENPAYKDNIIYQRVLVPKGARLIEAQGFADAADLPRLAQPFVDLPLKADLDVASWQSGQVQDESGTRIGEEAGYTFFANWMVTKPGQTTVGLYRYVLPKAGRLPGFMNGAARYQMYVAKQPGDERSTVRLTFLIPKQYRIEHAVPPAGITIHSEQEAVYRAELGRDISAGVVIVAK